MYMVPQYQSEFAGGRFSTFFKFTYLFVYILTRLGGPKSHETYTQCIFKCKQLSIAGLKFKCAPEEAQDR